MARFRVREAIDEAGLLQKDVADRAGLSPTTVNRLCQNHTAQVHLSTLAALADVLGVEPGELIVRETPKRRTK
jgi:transcriptional regulator with XRE-family HTH domain